MGLGSLPEDKKKKAEEKAAGKAKAKAKPKAKGKAQPKPKGRPPKAGAKASAKLRSKRSHDADGAPPPKKTKARKSMDKTKMVTPEKVTRRAWTPSPIAVKSTGSPSKVKRQIGVRLEKAASALAEIRVAMSGKKNDFSGPADGYDGFHKTILDQINYYIPESFNSKIWRDFG